MQNVEYQSKEKITGQELMKNADAIFKNENKKLIWKNHINERKFQKKQKNSSTSTKYVGNEPIIHFITRAHTATLNPVFSFTRRISCVRCFFLLLLLLLLLL